jgi:hypothetical protein
MTKTDLIARLLADTSVSEESARYFIRAMGGTYDIGAPASKQGGGTFSNFYWCGPMLAASDALTLSKLRVFLTWNKQASYSISERDGRCAAVVNQDGVTGKHPICALAACCVQLWGVDA